MKRFQVPFLGLLATLTILLISCSFDPPGMPTWTIEATIPFSQRVYRMGELVTDSNRLEERGWGIVINRYDSTLQFESRSRVDHQPIGDNLYYEESEIGRYTNYFDTIRIDPPSIKTDSIFINEVNPLLRAGYVGVVPSFTISRIADTLEFDVFRRMKVVRGQFHLSLKNGYPFPIENIVLALYNADDDSLLGVFNIARRIAGGVTIIDSLDLAGKEIHNPIYYTLNGRSPGSGVRLSITGSEVMVVQIGLSESKVEWAEAEISEQSFLQDDKLEYENRNKVIRADIQTGSANVVFRNTTRLRLKSRVIFGNLIDAFGEPVEKTVILEPEQISDVEILDISGNSLLMSLDEQFLQVYNEVIVEDTRITRYLGDSYQYVSNNQGVEVEYWTNGLVLSFFRGVLDSIRFEIPNIRTLVDMPEGLDSLDFMQDSLYLDFENQSSIPMHVEFSITTSNSITDRWSSLPIIIDLEPGHNSLTIPGSDRLLSVIPDRINFSGTIGLGKLFFSALEDSVVEVTNEEGISGLMILRVSLKFSNGTTQMITNLHEMAKPFDYPVEMAVMNVKLLNSIPMRGKMKFLLGNDSLRMVTAASFDIPRSRIVNRRVESAVETTYSVEFSDVALRRMRLEPLYSQQVIELYRSQGDTVWIYPEDSLSVVATATVRYTINEKDDPR